jgi:hypothetical protein
MNKIDTSFVVDPTIQQPFTSRSLNFLQDADKDMVTGMCMYIVGDSYDTAKGYVLSGLTNTGTIYFTGYIFYNGELYYCSGADIAGYAHAARLLVDVTNDGVADPLTFTDGIARNVHNIRKLKIQDVAAGGFLLTDLIFCQQPTVKLREKIITSAVWNMDTTPQITVAHGLTLSKIRCVEVMIINNAVTLLSPIGVGNYATSGSFPDANGRVEIGATYVVLDARVGGQFDAAAYNASYAYITIKYVD